MLHFRFGKLQVIYLEQSVAVIGSDTPLGTASELAEAEDDKHTDHGIPHLVFGSWVNHPFLGAFPRAVLQNMSTSSITSVRPFFHLEKLESYYSDFRGILFF